jgi:hypothetical protein
MPDSSAQIELERCVHQERFAAELLRSDHPDERGLRQAITDWAMEQALILRGRRWIE